MDLATELAARDEPVCVGIVGAGMFGAQVIHSIEGTAGLTTAGVADLEPDRAVAALEEAGVAASEIDRFGDADPGRALGDRRRTVTTDGVGLARAGGLDVVVDATGDPDTAVRVGLAALGAGTHFVNVSVEADTVCGAALADRAADNGVIYSLTLGDQPGQIVELVRWAEATGFSVVAAGRSTREPARYGTPDDALERHGFAVPFGTGLEPDPFLYNSFIDGTKLAVETVAAANALGLEPDVTGTHCPTLAASEVPDRLRPAADGGVLSGSGVIDSAVVTDDSFSAFVVATAPTDHLARYYARRPGVTTSDDGRYHLFSRRSHIAAETTLTVARAALRGESTGTFQCRAAEVVAAAKRDLEPGETIDGGGGYTVYGLVEHADRADAAGAVPFELLTGAEVTRRIGRDEVVTEDAVELETDRTVFGVRAGEYDP